MQGTWVQSLVQKILWRKEWLPIPVSLSREFYGQRSLVGYIVHQGHKESDTTEWLTHMMINHNKYLLFKGNLL